MNDPILQILVQNGYLDEASAQEIADTAKTEGKTIRQAVLDQEILSEDDLLGVIAAYQDTEAIDLGGMTLEMFNPRIISRSVPYEAVEGCLSLYGARSVTRYKNIKVEWKTRAFQTRTQTFTGLIAQIIQHEIDHCNGILI